MKVRATRDGDRVMVFVNGETVKHVVKHSPTGMEYGYGGSGPADTAQSILLTVLPKDQADRLYQQFKWDFVAKWQGDSIEEEIDLDLWIKEKVRLNEIQ